MDPNKPYTWTKSPDVSATLTYGVSPDVWYTRTVLITAPGDTFVKSQIAALSAGCRVEAEAGRAKWVL